MPPILLPLDGSQLAEEALPWAQQFARASGESLVLVSVYGSDEQMWEAAQIDPNVNITGARAQLANYLDRTSQQAAAPGVAVTTEVRAGDVAEQVLRAVQDHQASAIVLTTHGRGGFDGSGRGSVADKLVRRANVPVLVVPPHVPAGPVESLVVPVDGSEAAASAVPVARRLAHQLSARVHLVSVVDPAITWAFPEEGGLRPSDHLRERAESYLSQLKSSDEVSSVVSGRPSAAVVEYATQRDAQLIVMATHGRSGAVRLDLGSVADDVVRRSRCPVLLVPVRG
jgi:nucleotide-binding universal stress UspA family protein